MRGGGSERQVLLLAQHLDRSQFEPHLYLTDAVGDFMDDVPADVKIHSFDTQPSGHGLYYPGRELKRQTAFLREVIQTESIDAIYDRTFHMTMIAGKASGNVRRVSTIVSPPHLALPLVETRFVELKRRRLAKAYRASSAVVAVSQQAASSAEAYYQLAPDSVTVIRNPVDRNALSDATHQVSLGTANQTRLVCVGRMTSEKGQSDFIQAIQAVLQCWPESRPPLSVRLVGDGPLRRSLETQVAEASLGQTIQFVGALPNAAAEIQAADALILPSRFEGMPNVVLEAMALGTPVIATRAGGTVELEKNEPTIFWAQPGNVDSISNAILQFAKDPNAAQRHVVAATKLIETDHDVKQAVQRIERLLAGERGRG